MRENALTMKVLQMWPVSGVKTMIYLMFLGGSCFISFP